MNTENKNEAFVAFLGGHSLRITLKKGTPLAFMTYLRKQHEVLLCLEEDLSTFVCDNDEGLQEPYTVIWNTIPEFWKDNDYGSNLAPLIIHSSQYLEDVEILRGVPLRIPVGELGVKLKEVMKQFSSPSSNILGSNWLAELQDIVEDSGVSVESFVAVSSGAFVCERNRLRVSREAHSSTSSVFVRSKILLSSNLVDLIIKASEC